MANNSIGEFKPVMEKLASETDIMKIMECPICSENLTGQIFLCMNGHSICKTCKEKVPVCPTCRSDWSGRNFMLEQIIQSSILACSFKTEGCNVVGVGEFIQKHVKECHLRPIKCLYLGFTSLLEAHATEKVYCVSSTLKLENIVQHLALSHGAKVVESETIHLRSASLYNPAEIVEGTHRFFCSGVLTFDTKFFSVTFIASNEHDRFFCVVVLLGPREEEGNYRAKIVVQPGMKEMIAWEFPVQSIFDRNITSVLRDGRFYKPTLTWTDIQRIQNSEAGGDSPIKLNLKCTISKFDEEVH